MLGSQRSEDAPTAVCVDGIYGDAGLVRWMRRGVWSLSARSVVAEEEGELPALRDAFWCRFSHPFVVSSNLSRLCRQFSSCRRGRTPEFARQLLAD